MSKFQEDVDFLIKQGIHGLYHNSSIGEQQPSMDE
jgi:dihydrodipicolinate synthase/N-acetylneuraminate lyase